MAACDRLTLTGLQDKLDDFGAGHSGVEYSKDQHGAWVQERGTKELGRIAYRIVDGPLIVLWSVKSDKVSLDSSFSKRLREIETWNPHCWSLCHPDCLDLRPDLPPDTWFDAEHGPGVSVGSLFAEADILGTGVVRWGTQVPLNAPGVYIAALTDDASRTSAALPQAPLGERALAELLRRCDGLRVDGHRPSSAELSERIGSFWLSDQTVLYVGKAGTSVRKRVDQYYRTPLGARSPHAGGWFLKTLANLNDFFVHFGASQRPEESERRILEAFTAAAYSAAEPGSPYSELPLPFANLQLPGGRRKRHGITGATGCGSGNKEESVSSTAPSTDASSNQPDKVTLHQEIVAILEANGNRWMSTSEIAGEVHRRGIYKKRDGTSNVTDFQVHGRTKNYPHLFERDGSRARLR